ncbi:AAA family ATPase [Sorangium sp. So ce1128]
MNIAEVGELCERLKAQIARVVVGQEATIEALLVALLCRGHVLLEGVPGTAKTLLAQTFSRSLALAMKRIQFTPDLMPGDVVGTNLFNFQTNSFTLTRGPVFTELLLADEINRTPPKTQAALLQAMQERGVTIDGQTHALSESFFVVATQNPIEQEGTYPLPEAQLDRFLLKIRVGYPSRDEEREVVRRHGSRSSMPDLDAFDLAPIVGEGALAEARAAIAEIRLTDAIVDYIVDLVRATREVASLLHGASPRASTLLAVASRAVAALRGRAFVIPDDVKEIFLPSMRHRLVLSPGAEVEGLTEDTVLDQVLASVPTPR